MKKSFSELENVYEEAASELHAVQSALGNYAEALSAFISARNEIREHPDFLGSLPQTFFSGGDLDPEGTEPPLLPWATNAQ